MFYERRGHRVEIDRTGPWLPSKQLALTWAQWFESNGYHVALQAQTGGVERMSAGLPG